MTIFLDYCKKYDASLGRRTNKKSLRNASLHPSQQTFFHKEEEAKYTYLFQPRLSRSKVLARSVFMIAASKTRHNVGFANISSDYPEFTMSV